MKSAKEVKVRWVKGKVRLTQVLGNEVLAVVHNEHAAHVELDVVALLFVFKQVEGRAFGTEEQSAEFKLTFNREVLHRQVVFPVVGERFVELAVFILKINSFLLKFQIQTFFSN